MSEPNFAMDHHHVPQCYLKGFTDSKKRIWALELKAKHIRRAHHSSVKGVGYVPDFYKLMPGPYTPEAISDPHFIEKQINARFENNLNNQIKRIKTLSSIVNYNERYQFAETIVHLKRRNKYFRNKIYTDQQLRVTKEKVVKDTKETGKLTTWPQFVDWPIDELNNLLEEVSNSVINGPEATKNFHNLSLADLTVHDRDLFKRAYHSLATARWTVFEAPILQPFITSDNPGFLVDNQGILKNMGFEGRYRFFLPLDSRHLLLIEQSNTTFSDFVEKRFLHSQEIQRINLCTAQLSVDQIFGSQPKLLESIKIDFLLQAT